VTFDHLKLIAYDRGMKAGRSRSACVPVYSQRMRGREYSWGISFQVFGCICELRGSSPRRLALALIHSSAGRLRVASRTRYVAPSYFAIVYTALGDQDQAFAWLEKSYQDRSEHMLYLKVEPLVDPLRNDPRFESLLKRVGLDH
jgi:hypothetical protein